jgi:hypothetical protein
VTFSNWINLPREGSAFRVYGGEDQRIAIITTANRPAAVPSTSAAPNARFHAADRLLAQLNTTEASRPNAAAATAASRLVLNIQ